MSPGRAIAESNAILLYLAERTPLLPDDPFERAQVHQWMFFEQNQLEPNAGTARFWRLCGLEDSRPEVFAARRSTGADAVAVLDRHLADREYVAAGALTVADVALYAYAHVAPDAGIPLEPHPAVRAWIARVEAQPGFVNDLEPYPRGDYRPPHPG